MSWVFGLGFGIGIWDLDFGVGFRIWDWECKEFQLRSVASWVTLPI